MRFFNSNKQLITITTILSVLCLILGQRYYSTVNKLKIISSKNSEYLLKIKDINKLNLAPDSITNLAKFNELNVFYEKNFGNNDNNFKVNPKFKAHGHDYSDVILNKLKSLLSIQRKIFFEDKYYETSLENIIEDEVYDVKFGRISIPLPDKSFGINTQGTAYIDINKNNLILTTADGDFYTSKVETQENNSIKLKNIESNITTLIDYPEFYEDSMYGIKDILLHEGNLYISYINQIYKNNCWGIVVAKSKFNGNYLNFEVIYKPNSCVSIKGREGFWPHLTGGKLAKLNKNKIAVSVGAFAFGIGKSWPSDEVEFGKIMEININDYSKNVISSGHRNPQGLFYSKKRNVLLSTEHGPKGGDELNFIKLDGTKQDFGWPSASYGYSYWFKKGDEDIFLKSHKDNGFIEPKYFWTPSIGISAVEECSLSKEHSRLFIASLGNAKEEGTYENKFLKGKFVEESLSIIAENGNDFPSINKKVIRIGGRIRDLICDEDRKKVWYWDETNKGIGILNLKKN
tara:strand:- start:12525 stop:14072 length:1548 start_codon:yes stop_codon:yes gene_type:complete